MVSFNVEDPTRFAKKDRRSIEVPREAGVKLWSPRNRRMKRLKSSGRPFAGEGVQGAARAHRPPPIATGPRHEVFCEFPVAASTNIKESP